MRLLRPLSAYKQQKYLSAIVDKGRRPDPGRHFIPSFLLERLIEEADIELNKALQDLEKLSLTDLRAKQRESTTDYDIGEDEIHVAYSEVMKELADVANFVDYLEEAILESYRIRMSTWYGMKK